MARKKQPNIPAEIPVPDRIPEIRPKEPLEEPVVPGPLREPDPPIEPDEPSKEPGEPSPGKIPPRAKDELQDFQHGSNTGPDPVSYALRFITLLLAAFALVPGMAHLLEMPHKMQLTEENFGIVQYLYRGWAWLGTIQVGAVLSTGVLYLYERKNKPASGLLLAAFVCLALTLVIFFTFTYPANVVTKNWSFVPDNWQVLRNQWEYSHAANALLEGLAYILLLLATLRTK